MSVGSTSMRRLITAGNSFLTQEPAEAHFGLGSASVVDRLTVHWPAGGHTTLINVPADQVLTIDDIAFTDGFESGDFSAWRTSLPLAEPSPPLSITASPVFRGQHATRLEIRNDCCPNDGANATLEDTTPAGDEFYAARFYLHTDELNLGIEDRFDHLVGVRATGAPEFKLAIRYDISRREHRLFAEVQTDDIMLTTQHSQEVTLPGRGWHWIEVNWIAARNSSSRDGSLRFCVDSLTNCARITQLNNPQAKIESVLWGATGIVGGDLGSLVLDGFDSRRSPNIGPAPSERAPRETAPRRRLRD